MNEVIICIIVLLISIMCGTICARTINKLMEGKIKQHSWEYQICGYLFANIAAFGGMISIGRLIGIILERVFL